MKKILNAKIISNKKVSGEYRKIVLNAPSIAKTAVPGQFVTLKLGSGNVPFLRRPMSIHKIKPPVIELLYKVRGVGTELLAKYNEKDTLEILGPLGNGFKTDGSFSTAILVGGGYGIAPLLALHDRLKKLDKKIITIIGAKSKTLVNKEGFTGALIATEDGSDGIKGLVTKILSSTCCNLSTDSVIFACGPDKMLKAVSEAGRLHNIPCQISMENLMACGVGVCLSCVCAVKQGLKTENKRVCVDGPVFDAEEIIWQI
ncbi:MAG: dihydroorotate dehydrogenase electron transfer subunit [Candidatus Firestonebacteria bacterium]|nr:dihydroorotate dehydrogenase electron transfer subunit [Candidatus Firestonebacteria bacterium]